MAPHNQNTFKFTENTHCMCGLVPPRQWQVLLAHPVLLLLNNTILLVDISSQFPCQPYDMSLSCKHKFRGLFVDYIVMIKEL